MISHLVKYMHKQGIFLLIYLISHIKNVRQEIIHDEVFLFPSGKPRVCRTAVAHPPLFQRALFSAIPFA